ncbi:MAG: HD domain-containing protein [Armatimonadota bacterium]|nr:HD domain-containing protein [Armatimonadota bacterium]MDR7448722.1 HD domain-containing protein [Armatimonadota bacterium]MDR7460258.1 HD domain-containing protein [Armatimonadota bacterium]MDR7479060.1 HD domain-containing protein [Armatimonadota bacterium]MDR7488664.1 HD domain-containing protein [Armatimonadota bacterium]
MTGPRPVASSPRFEAALRCAVRWHAKQPRKGTRVSYVAHLLGVAALVLEDGGDEAQAVAALLHDALEDRGGVPVAVRRAEIRRRFGPRVLAIVEGCTDTVDEPKPPWRLRKEAYLAHLRHVPREVLRVSLADKLHNARAILADHARVGDRVWERFRPRSPRDLLWYYRRAARIFLEREGGPMAAELQRAVRRMAGLVHAQERSGARDRSVAAMRGSRPAGPGRLVPEERRP